LIISVIALVLAASGSAVAATRLTSGDKLISKASLSGNRLRKHTLTGTQINLKKLGTVPRATTAVRATAAQTAVIAQTATAAKRATTAQSATSAQTAQTAVSAQSAQSATSAQTAVSATTAQTAATAANATELGGQPASSYMQGTRIGTAGIVTETGTAAGATVTLFTSGPFTVTMTCTRAASGMVALSLDGTSSVEGSALNGTLGVAAGTATDLGPTVDLGATASPGIADDTTMDFEAPGGSQAIVSGATGVNSLGTDCWANFSGIA
jgi:hypothetical protein